MLLHSPFNSSDQCDIIYICILFLITVSSNMGTICLF
jgi:hypothetical protein